MTTKEQEQLDNLEDAYRENNPERPSPRLLPLHSNDWWFVGFMFSVTIWSNTLLGRIGLTGSLALTIALLLPNHDDRYWRVVLTKPYDWWIRRYHHGVLYRPGIVIESPWKFWRKLPQLRLPKVVFIKTNIDEFPQIAATANPDGTFSFVVVGDGNPLAAYDLAGQSNIHSKFADLVTRAAATLDGMAFSASYHFRRRPVNILDTAGITTELLRKEVCYPETIDPPAELADIPHDQWANVDEDFVGQPLSEWSPELRKAVRSARMHKVMFDELPVVCLQEGQDAVMAMVCTVKPTGVIKDAIRGKKARRSQLRTNQLIQLVQTIVDGLRECEVTNPRVLNMGEFHEYIRGGWDVVNILGYYEGLAEQVNLLPDRHWPEVEITVSKKSISIDGTKHTVLRVTSTPGFLPPDYLRTVFGADVPWLAVSTPTLTSSSTREVGMMERAGGVMDSFRDVSGRMKESRKQRRKRETLETREERYFEAMYRSDFNILIAVSAEDEELLEHRITVVKRHLRRFNINCKEVSGETRQLPALLTAVTGIRLI